MYITADVVASMCASTRNHGALGVIDAGDGKGYLSTRLSLEHKIQVLGVDYNPVNTRGALLRSEKLEVRLDVYWSFFCFALKSLKKLCLYYAKSNLKINSYISSGTGMESKQ